MSFLADIDPIECFVRREMLYNQQTGHGEVEPAVLFGVTSIPAQATLFRIYIPATKACIDRVPVHMLVHKEDAPLFPVDVLQLWDSFSYDIAVHEYAFLSGKRVDVKLKDGSQHQGQYVLTLDWRGNNYSERPGELGHKDGHLLALDNGCFAIQPNNRILWHDPAVSPLKASEPPDYLTNTHVWSCESSGTRWATEDSDRAHYDVDVKGS